MRRLLALALALAALPQVAASEPYVVLLDWQEGFAPVGTTSLAVSPLAARFPLGVDACHRALLLDLLYDPAEAGVDQEGLGEVFLQYDWLVQLAQDDVVLSQTRVRAPGYGFPLGVADAAGEHEVRLSLANGAAVSYEVRVRGREMFGELACEPRIVIDEVEANPAGVDAGAEWIEIHNAGDEGADLSAWIVRATHGTPAELTLPEGTWLGAGERLVVVFADGQFLDNVDEVVELVDPLRGVRDATPALSDDANDARTWQRAADGASWQFATGTPGSPGAA